MRDGVEPTRSVRTLGDFLDEWLGLQRDRLRPTTWHCYGHAVARIKSSLGRSKLQALAPLQLEHFYESPWDLRRLSVLDMKESNEFTKGFESAAVHAG
jgi:hypothetical protein